jgi:hypothetical protein
MTARRVKHTPVANESEDLDLFHDHRRMSTSYDRG